MNCKKAELNCNKCIFCLEVLNYINKIHYENEIQENENEIELLNVINKNINLKCNHNFHIDCFFLYLKHNKEKLRILPCPLCRYDLSRFEIIKILIVYLFYLKKLQYKIKMTKNNKDNKDNFVKNKISFRSKEIYRILYYIL